MARTRHRRWLGQNPEGSDSPIIGQPVTTAGDYRRHQALIHHSQASRQHDGQVVDHLELLRSLKFS
jgi:hypothetical protein